MRKRVRLTEKVTEKIVDSTEKTAVEKKGERVDREGEGNAIVQVDNTRNVTRNNEGGGANSHI